MPDNDRLIIRPNSGAQIDGDGHCPDTDEVIGWGDLHVEQMSETSFWARLYRPGQGHDVVMWFGVNEQGEINLSTELEENDPEDGGGYQPPQPEQLSVHDWLQIENATSWNTDFSLSSRPELLKVFIKLGMEPWRLPRPIGDIDPPAQSLEDFCKGILAYKHYLEAIASKATSSVPSTGPPVADAEPEAGHTPEPPEESSAP